jgi:hypothetical protein
MTRVSLPRLGDAGATIPDWEIHNLQCCHYTSVAMGSWRSETQL